MSIYTNKIIAEIFERLDRIEKAIGELKATRDSRELWVIKDVARYLRCSVRQAQAISNDPNFPKAVLMPNQSLEKKSTHKRFFIGDIVQYAERQQEK